MATLDPPFDIEGNLILLLSFPPLPSYPVESTHYLFVKRHEPRIPDPSTPRSLYLMNVPFDSTDIHMKLLFSTQLGLPAGKIEEVRFEDSRKERARKELELNVSKNTNTNFATRDKKRKRGTEDEAIPDVVGELPAVWDRELHRLGSNAIIVFADRASMEAALKAVRTARKQDIKPIWGEGLTEKLPPLGYERYLMHHKLSYPPKEQLLKSVDDYMTAFAAREAVQARVAARQRQEPDEDGFVKVTRGGRTGAARQEQAVLKLEKQKERQKGFDNFYRFQSREKRKEKAMELMRKFEEDREKIKKMKEQRGRFKPEI